MTTVCLLLSVMEGKGLVFVLLSFAVARLSMYYQMHYSEWLDSTILIVISYANISLACFVFVKVVTDSIFGITPYSLIPATIALIYGLSYPIFSLTIGRAYRSK